MGTATALALLPPLVAIVISLITKEVNLSLFLGIALGALMFCGFNPLDATQTMLAVAADKTSSNFCVLVFIVLLGMIVWLMNNSGATKRYADWARAKLKTKRQSLIATLFLGILIFMDDYFNCLTVGTIMRPVTDSHGVSREKLAYVIDSTAAPICIIAPVSSWAAAVSSSLPENSSIDGFQLFLQTIPCNFYALFCLLMVLIVVVGGVNIGKMAVCERDAMRRADSGENTMWSEAEEVGGTRGRMVDLVVPVLSLIFLSLLSMLYTGGLFEGASIADAFANCDAITGLAMGSVFTVFVVAALYLPRRVVTFKEFLDALVRGFEHMVPASLILILAWTLSGICGSDYLNAGGFVAELVSGADFGLGFVPAVFFAMSVLLAFSTGTSWGTFAIMLPIAVTIFGEADSFLLVLSSAAVLSGSVCGDHLSPISDTTILSATGSGCDHLSHVETQLPYGVIVAVVSGLMYLMSGYAGSYFASLVCGAVILVVVALAVKKTQARKVA